MNDFVLLGDIVYTQTQDKFSCVKNGYLLCRDGLCSGVVTSLDEAPDFADAPLFDYSGKLILPGFTDIHLHAPQYTFRGVGMDLPLMDWLQKYTFPEEAKYSNLEYARHCYELFTGDLLKSATTRAVVFGTIHLDATLHLADLFEKSGMKILLGKVNMDQNATDALNENTERSIADTETFIKRLSQYKNVKPIITPRFVPSCSAELMQGLGELAAQYNVPIQSHLSENYAEIAFVKELYPDCETYAHVYDKFGLLNSKTVMAHCVHSDSQECNLLAERGVFVAHCPQSNTNLMSGAAPVVQYLTRGLKVAMGTDIAGGTNANMFRSGGDAMHVSKLRSCLLAEQGKKEDCLQPSQVFYMMTKAGGAFFEHSFGTKTGSFEKGYAFDAIVIDDSSFDPFTGKLHPADSVIAKLGKTFRLEDRVERLLYLADERHIVTKYVDGECVYEKSKDID